MARKPKLATEIVSASDHLGASRSYIARYYAVVTQDGGDRRIEPGQIVVIDGDTINAYPVERFIEAFPDIATDSIDLEPEIAH